MLQKQKCSKILILSVTKFGAGKNLDVKFVCLYTEFYFFAAVPNTEK